MNHIGIFDFAYGVPCGLKTKPWFAKEPAAGAEAVYHLNAVDIFLSVMVAFAEDHRLVPHTHQLSREIEHVTLDAAGLADVAAADEYDFHLLFYDVQIAAAEGFHAVAVDEQAVACGAHFKAQGWVFCKADKCR